MRKLLLSMIVLGASVTLRAQNPYPILPIDSVQFVNQPKLDSAAANTLPDYVTQLKNPTYGDTVRFEGIVISNPKIYGLSASRKASYIQRKGGGPWSGVQVMCEPVGSGAANLQDLITQSKFYENFVVGYKVRVTGVIRNFQGETQVNLIKNAPGWDNFVEQVSLTPDTLVYSNISASQLMTGNPNTTWVQQKSTAEQYEGTLVNITNVTVYSIQQSGNRTFWSVIDDFGNVLDVRDFSAYIRRDDLEDTIPKIPNTFQPPAIGTRLEYIRGVVTEYAASGVQRYGISPLYPSDIGPCNICPPKILSNQRTPSVATSTDSVAIAATIVGDTTITAATLHYAVAGTNTFTVVNMTENIGLGKWIAKIPPFTANTVIKYFTRATDARNLKATFPDSLATNSNYLVTDSGVNNIRTLQFSANSSGATIWNGDSLLNLDVRGVITGINFNAGATRLLTLQDGTGANSAIFIQRADVDDATAKWSIGDSVQITRATVRESFNVTTLNNILGTVISHNNPLPSFETGLSLDSFALNKIPYSRKWEAVLLRWDSVLVSNINPDAPSDFEEWSFHKDTTKTGIRVDDMSFALNKINDSLTKGQLINFVQGPMYFAFGNFKMMPRSLADIDMCSKDMIKPNLNLLGNTSDTVEIGAAYTDPGATATDSKDGNITNRIMVTGTVNGNVIGTYVLVYKVSDYCGNWADSAIRSVVVIDTPSVGVKENELNNAQLSLYPNPANESITISANSIKTQPVTVTIMDVLGRELLKRTYAQTQFTDNVNVSNFNNGVYFCVISNDSGKKTLKFIVNTK
jgi:hypothetical protein